MNAEKLLAKEVSYNKLMDKRPTMLGFLAGYCWYEDPVYGDEAPLLATKAGKAYRTTIFEMEDIYLT